MPTVSDLVQLATFAPWAAVGVLALAAAAWVYRQGRRDVRRIEDAAALSARRQGERLGKLEHAAGLLDLRRRQVEWVLTGDGLDLPYWPPDGPDQPRARTEDRSDHDDYRDGDGPQPGTEARRLPVPPLPEMARHRR